MEKSFLSNTDLSDEYVDMVRQRVKEFTNYMSKTPLASQREMSLQIIQIFGMEPSEGILKIAFNDLVEKLINSSQDFFATELIYWGFLMATHRTPELFPFFFLQTKTIKM
ncbi:hypothetical protein QTN25_008922 [Entamoeba marina]